MLYSNDWLDYELIDMRYGEKLERWGKYILIRPDPQVIWPASDPELWKKADAYYHRSKSGGGSWEYLKNLPSTWNISYKSLVFHVEPMGFKHTGIFPEQAANWDWLIHKISNARRNIRVLNLFAYTGAATVACSFAGAEVCHVDSAKGIVSRAKTNIELSGLSDRKVRYIVDDVVKFVKREYRRGNKYDGIIMDPPSFGRGPNGETWKIEDMLYPLIEDCINIFSEQPLFFLINSYTSGFSPIVLENILNLAVKNKFGGNVFCDELGIKSSVNELTLPCGIVGRWELE